MRRRLVLGAIAVAMALGWFPVARRLVVPRLSGSTLILADDVTKLYRDGVQEMFRTQCEILAEDPRLKATMLTPGMDEATVVDILNDLEQLTAADVIIVLSPNGRVKGQVGVDALNNLDVSSAALVKKAQAASGAISGVWVIGDKMFDLGACGIRAHERLVAYLWIGRTLGGHALSRIAQITGVGVGLLAGDQILASAPETPSLATALGSLAHDQKVWAFKALDSGGYTARVLGVAETTPPARLAFLSNGATLLARLVLFGPSLVLLVVGALLLWQARALRAEGR